MKDDKLTQLQAKVEQQQAIISNYEKAIPLLRWLRRIPLFGGVFRFFSNAMKTKTFTGTLVRDEVKGKKPDIIAVTNPQYRGVSSATKEMVGDLFYVTEINSRQRAKSIANAILHYNPKQVLVSGYATGHDLLIEELKKQNPTLRISVLIHSAFIWFDEYPAQNEVFEKYISLAKKGVIEKVGFCKRDLAEYFKALGVNTYFVMNRFYPEKHVDKRLSKDKIKIGIWGKNVWHRNITNQVVASLMVGNTEIHTNESSQHFFLDGQNVTIHGFMEKEDYQKLFSTMDINLYISLTECFPMTVIESMQYGIPCLVSDTSDVYSFSPYLKNILTVSSIDSPIGISEKIKEVTDNYDKIQSEIKKYLPVLKEKTEQSIQEFLR